MNPATTPPAVPERRDFAGEIESNKRLSLMLLVVFPVLIGALGWGIGWYFGGYTEIGVGAALLVAAIFIAVTWFSGDKMILTMAGARKAESALDARVINVVEEMALASGLPKPSVYIIDTDALNAFATGRDPEHATVAFTRGIIDTLTREELQAVAAHELGHVRNFDIRYAMLVAALVGSVVLLADGLRRSLWWGAIFGGGGRRRDSNSGGGPAQLIGLVVVILLAILAPLAAVFVQMAISRKREYLADASAVEMTRNPQALASALRKIGGLVPGVGAGDPKYAFADLPPGAKNRALQHLYIANPLELHKRRVSAAMSTHPPIEERIERLEAMV